MARKKVNKQTSKLKRIAREKRQRKYYRDILGRFAKKNKKPPIRYRRPVPPGMVKEIVGIDRIYAFKTGDIIEYTYGRKQVQGQVGGWKTDPRPVLLVFHDTNDRYIEGINTNYLSDYYLRKLRAIMVRFPGIDGERLYDIVKRTANYSIKKGYRKYIRTSLRNLYRYVYEEEILKRADEIVKKNA